jgi:hypothetical protein
VVRARKNRFLTGLRRVGMTRVLGQGVAAGDFRPGVRG